MSYREDIRRALKELAYNGELGSRPVLDDRQASMVAGFICELRDPYRWHDAKKHKPTIGRPIEMTGPSGYIAPNDRRVVSGFYDPVYRPLAAWREESGSSVGDCGLEPTHWRYLTPEPYPKQELPSVAVGDLVEVKKTGARLFIVDTACTGGKLYYLVGMHKTAVHVINLVREEFFRVSAPELQPIAENNPLDGHSHSVGVYCKGCAELMGKHSEEYRAKIEGQS